MQENVPPATRPYRPARLRLRPLAIVGILLLAVSAGGCRQRESLLKLGGGPRGGSFENIASGLADILNRELTNIRVVVESSGGSVANLIDVQEGKLSMGLVFAGDAYLGREGRLKEDLPPTTGVLALARLYGATAHLVISRFSSIHTVSDLGGLRVAIGSSGSGSAMAARRYFQSLGLWESIVPIYEGYSIGVEEMRMGYIDAVWLQVGYPSEYLLGLFSRMQLRFLDLAEEVRSSGFFTDYPFYTPIVIPAETYQGQSEAISTFQDAALWVANPGVSAEVVYAALSALFSDKGMKRMREAHPAAWDMSLAKGLMGVKIPMHPGAERFWRGKGVALPSGPTK